MPSGTTRSSVAVGTTIADRPYRATKPVLLSRLPRKGVPRSNRPLLVSGREPSSRVRTELRQEGSERSHSGGGWPLCLPDGAQSGVRGVAPLAGSLAEMSPLSRSGAAAIQGERRITPLRLRHWDQNLPSIAEPGIPANATLEQSTNGGSGSTSPRSARKGLEQRYARRRNHRPRPSPRNAQRVQLD